MTCGGNVTYDFLVGDFGLQNAHPRTIFVDVF